MKICQKTKHEISISACAAVERESVLRHLGREGSTTGFSPAEERAGTQTAVVPSHWAVKVLKLLIDFAKTAIYISKFFFNKLLFKVTCRWKVLAPFFPKLDFLAAYEKPYIVLYINRSLKCRDEAMACNLLCFSSGTVLIHLHKKGDMQSSMTPHQNQPDLSTAIRRRQGSPRSQERSPQRPWLRPCCPSECCNTVTVFSAAVVLFVCLIKRGPLCLWPIRQSSEREIMVVNMHAIKSMWPGLVCIMLECIHVYHACIHLLLPGGKIIASSVPLARRGNRTTQYSVTASLHLIKGRKNRLRKTLYLLTEGSCDRGFPTCTYDMRAQGPPEG